MCFLHFPSGWCLLLSVSTSKWYHSKCWLKDNAGNFVFFSINIKTEKFSCPTVSTFCHFLTPLQPGKSFISVVHWSLSYNAERHFHFQKMKPIIKLFILMRTILGILVPKKLLLSLYNVVSEKSTEVRFFVMGESCWPNSGLCFFDSFNTVLYNNGLMISGISVFARWTIIVHRIYIENWTEILSVL